MGLAQPTPLESRKDPSLALYVAETAPSSFERRFWYRWALLAFIAALLHFLAFYFAPTLFRPAPPAPVEVTQIDPAKLDAIKRQWKQRGFVLSKDAAAPKEKINTPKDARYESDRNRKVEKETRARQTNVIPNVAGSPEGKAQQDHQGKTATKSPAKKIPLSNLSNFQGLPMPRTPEEQDQAAQQRRGGPGNTGDQALMDDSLPVGAENMLNTAESVYYTFYARMYEQIGPLWQSQVSDIARRLRLSPGDYTTQAEIIFDSDGNFLEARIMNSSGKSELDQAVPSAWKRIPRFPNPPRGLIQPDGKIHMGWTFTVRIDDRMQWQYAPPQREF